MYFFPETIDFRNNSNEDDKPISSEQENDVFEKNDELDDIEKAKKPIPMMPITKNITTVSI